MTRYAPFAFTILTAAIALAGCGAMADPASPRAVTEGTPPASSAQPSVYAESAAAAAATTASSPSTTRLRASGAPNVAEASIPASAVPTDAVGSSEVDATCASDADCVVKDVGNCCGAYPACVNRNSPTFPERVKRECEAKGMSSICGFRDISSCACVSGQCAAADGSGALQ